jgi:hypothetical protein
MDEAIAEAGGVGAALEALRLAGYCRLRPITPEPLNPLAAFVAAYHLGDPIGPGDSWRPWKRKMALTKEVARVRKIPRTSASPQSKDKAPAKPSARAPG